MASKLSVGRKTAHEWLDVDLIDNKAKCKHCGLEVSNKIERIRLHLKKCEKFVSQKEDSDEPDVKRPKQEDLPGPSRSMKQAKLQEFVMKTTEQKKDKLDAMVADFFYANNIPFNVAESTYFKALIEELRPGYKPPSSRQISGALLNKAAKSVDDKLKTELKNACVTLVQDGWSNIKHDAIVGTSIHTGSRSFLLEAEEAGIDKKTAEFCAEKACDAIKNIKDVYEKDVFAICSDNENKMKAMKEIVKQTYPDIIAIGCSAHYMNLVEKEVTPNTILKQLVEVQKYFMNVHLAHAWLKEKSCLAPVIPNATR